jgi:hypothetical protein
MQINYCVALLSVCNIVSSLVAGHGCVKYVASVRYSEGPLFRNFGNRGTSIALHTNHDYFGIADLRNSGPKSKHKPHNHMTYLEIS